MLKMSLQALMVAVVVITGVLGEKKLLVSLTDCEAIVNIDTELSVTLTYSGSVIRSCQYLVYTSKPRRDLCVTPEPDDRLGCSVKLQYSGGTFFPGSPDKEYSCSSRPHSWCTSRGMLYVTFVQNGTDIKSDVTLTIKSQEGSGEGAGNKALLMGIAIGCTVFVLACLAIVGYCCFVRRCSKRFHRKRKKQHKAVPTEDFHMPPR